MSDCLQLHEVAVQVQQHLVLDGGAGQPQVLPVGHLGDDPAAAWPGWWPSRGARLRRSWVSASAARAASGKGGMPTNVAVMPAPPSSRSLGRRQHVGEVQHPDPAALPGEQAADVHQAGVVPGDQHLGAGLDDVARLVGAHRDGRVGVLQRERAAEAAALVGAGQVDQPEAADGAQEARPAGPPRPASAASGRSGGRSPCAGSTPPRRRRPARRRGTPTARTSSATARRSPARGPRHRTCGPRCRAGAAPTRRTSRTASPPRRTRRSAR